MTKLTIKAFRGLLFLLLAMAALLFIPAHTLHYWQAWLFLAVYFIPSLAVILYLMKNDPQLLKRRMSGGPAAEKQAAQKIIMVLVSLGFVGLMTIPALDRRFHWSHMAPAVVLIGDAMILLGWLAIFFVFRENSFASSTVELAPNQKVISTGPYSLIRHPMYAAGLVLLSGIPIALGSWCGLLTIAVILPTLIWRLLDEEKFLAKNLTGYKAYQNKIRYRLLPMIW